MAWPRKWLLVTTNPSGLMTNPDTRLFRAPIRTVPPSTAVLMFTTPGLTAFTRGANEVGGTGVTVNNVMPGFTWTDRVEELAVRSARAQSITRDEVVAAWEAEIPLGRLAEPREFAALVAFLASDRAAYVTGASIPVDGGWIRSLL